MSKKLLSEAQVRRFQSLASIKPLQEMGNYAMKRDEANEEPMEEAYDEAAVKDDEQPKESLYEEEDDMGGDESEQMDEADVELDEELVEQFMDAVKTIEQVADALGGAGAGEEMDDMDDMDDMKMDAGAPDEMDAAPESDEDEEAVLQESLSGITYVPSQKEIVKLVAKRVAKRLNEAKRAQAKLDQALGKRK